MATSDDTPAPDAPDAPDATEATEATDWRAALTPPRVDRLGALTATARVMRAARLVSLDLAAIATLAERWATAPWPAASATLEALHVPGAPERAPNWTLLLDALNFCFWGEPGKPRWRVTWHGASHDGYDALAAALSRAVEVGLPVWDAEWLANLEAETLERILRPDAGCPMIPLFAERLTNAREVGRVLRGRYEGQFANVVEDAEYDAVTLALTLEREFSSFADVAEWEGQPVPFLKRAQICVADLRAITGGVGASDIHGIERLTAFADYKLPQLLRRFGAITYAPELAAQVDSYTLIPAGSPAEVEIRSATLWAVELLRRELARRGVSRTASEIDYRLWSESQTRAPDERPYHRTRTIYY
ncbi:MAG TPA: queuosine salvage family protein [Ktedonobacterales bacterium]|nr:queuosine salvage family protein [Ktedonobacterales bacterium]